MPASVMAAHHDTSKPRRSRTFLAMTSTARLVMAHDLRSMQESCGHAATNAATPVSVTPEHHCRCTSDKEVKKDIWGMAASVRELLARDSTRRGEHR